MIISKHIHSCVVVEQGGDRVLFDPGKFSFVEGRVSPEDFADVSAVVITHAHPDHLDPEALKAIVGLSGAPVIGNGEVVDKLRGQGIEARLEEEGVEGRVVASKAVFGIVHQAPSRLTRRASRGEAETTFRKRLSAVTTWLSCSRAHAR